MRRRSASGCTVLALGLTLAACGDGGGHDGQSSGLTVSMSFVPPAGGQDLLWLAEGQRNGDLLTVDVIARDITQPFDAYEVEVLFDPLVLRATSTQDGPLLASCSGQQNLTVNNILSGGAAMGSLLVGGVAQDAPGCTLAGQQTLVRLTFKAIEAGTSELDFGSGSRLFRTGGPASIAVTFFDSQASVVSAH